MLAKNEVLQGRYRIIRQLGKGGMGAVYEAKDERLGSSVALKEIIIELDKIPTEKQRELFLRAFEREAKLLANLHHEAFPRVMDYFSEEDRQFLIMELIHGDDLGALLDKNKRSFPLKDVLKWIDQLLDALDYLHTQNPPIFHRDIKPQNLKVTARGKIKLLDFGIAKSVDQTASTMTNHTFVGGTLNYSPIEQILPAIIPTFREFIILKHNEKAKIILNQNTDDRCDLYAVGATFYHLLTNSVPIDSAKRSLEIWEGNKDPLPSPSELNPEIPSAISAFLLKAMEIERENRFTSAIEMQEALQSIFAEEKKRPKAEGTPRIINDEKTLQLIETDYQPIVETTKNHGQNLTQAKTERLITGSEIKSETKSERPLDTRDPVSQAKNTLSSDIESSSDIKPFSTKSVPVEVFNTQPTGSVSKPELTGIPYFNEKLIEEKRPAPVPFIEKQPAEVSKSGAKLIWILPIAALGILTIGAIGGGAIWLSSSNSPSSTKFASNAVISTPTMTPSISPTIEPSASPTPVPTQNNVETKSKTPPPAAVSTPNNSPRQNSVKVPPTQKIPKPKKLQDPNCVLTNSCQ